MVTLAEQELARFQRIKEANPELNLAESTPEEVAAGLKEEPTKTFSRLPEKEPGVFAPPTKPKTFQEIRAEERKTALEGIQEGIKSVEDIHAARLERERETGQLDIGRQRSLAVLQGLAGTQEGQAGQVGAEQRTKKRIETQESIKSLEIEKLYQGALGLATKETELRLGAQKEELATEREEASSEAFRILQGFAGQGITLATLRKTDPDTFDALIDATGKNAFEIALLYEAGIPKAEQPIELFSGFKGNDFVRILQNADGSVDTEKFSATNLGIPEGVDPDFKTIGDSVYWYDKNEPKTDENGNIVMQRVGAAPGTDKDVVYDEKDLPGNIRTSIIEDLQDQTYAQETGELTIEKLASLYPEVQLETLRGLMDEFYDFDALEKAVEQEKELEGLSEEEKAKVIADRQLPWWQRLFK